MVRRVKKIEPQGLKPSIYAGTTSRLKSCPPPQGIYETGCQYKRSKFSANRAPMRGTYDDDQRTQWATPSGDHDRADSEAGARSCSPDLRRLPGQDYLRLGASGKWLHVHGRPGPGY